MAPGEWGNLLGLDRIPEVRTLRQKLEILCQQAGQAVRWNTELAKDWIAGQREATLRHDLVPWLETNAPASAELQQRMQDDPHQHRFTLVFDREGYSPEFFSEMKQRRIAMLSYHKFPGDAWPADEFSDCSVKLAGGGVMTMKLAERGSRLSNGLWVREVRKLSETGRQTSILSTNYRADYTTLAASMFARWSQENFYKYMRQHYNLDRLAEY